MLDARCGDAPFATVKAGGNAGGDEAVRCGHTDQVGMFSGEIALGLEGTVPSAGENVSEFLSSCCQF